MPATPVSRRKASRELPELPPGLLHATLLVPCTVFPKVPSWPLQEQVPAGFKGWRAKVVGADATCYDDGIHCTVKFEDYLELYHFPINEVRRWVVEAGDGSRTPTGRRLAAARAGAQVEAAAAEEEKAPQRRQRQRQQPETTRSASKPAVTPRSGRERAAASAAGTPYSSRKRQAEAPVDEQRQQKEAHQQGRRRQQEEAFETETDEEEHQELTVTGRVAAVLQQGLFTVLAVFIVYYLLSCFYQPLDSIA